MNSVTILNARFDPLSLEQTVDHVIELIRADRRGYLCTVNVAILMMMLEDERLQNFVDDSWRTVADGTPLVWASHILGSPLPERVTGVDLIECICERAAVAGLSVYLLGATTETVNKVAEHLRVTIPRLLIAGTADGYFDAETAPARALAIRDSGARILVVAMGVPRQEYFLQDQWEHLGVNFAIGVGGSFDVLAGLRRRAPRFLQVSGLEWAYRLAQEPRRLFKRYLYTNSRFIYLMAKECLSGK